MERFGEAMLLQFASPRLTWRHKDIKRLGAQTDYADYQPHIMTSWGAADVDLRAIESYKGKIVLGSEIFKNIEKD